MCNPVCQQQQLWEWLVLALLKIPGSGWKQMHMWIQESRDVVNPWVGFSVPIDGQLHVCKILLKCALPRVDLKSISMRPATSDCHPRFHHQDARKHIHGLSCCQLLFPLIARILPLR